MFFMLFILRVDFFITDPMDFLLNFFSNDFNLVCILMSAFALPNMAQYKCCIIITITITIIMCFFQGGPPVLGAAE